MVLAALAGSGGVNGGIAGGSSSPAVCSAGPSGRQQPAAQHGQERDDGCLFLPRKSLASLPRPRRMRLQTFKIDAFGDHICTCTSHPVHKEHTIRQ